MIRTIKALAGLLLATALVACGGGGGSSGATTGGNNNGGGGGGATAANIDVFTSASQLSSSPNSSVTFSVTVKDANNQALPNQPVSFSASSGNIVGAANATTGPNGEAVTSVSLNPGGDQTNRTIVVTVTSGGASRQVTVPVAGTTLSLSGPSSTLVGGTTTFTVTARDSAGQLVSGLPFTVSSTLANGRNPQTVTTVNGVATFVYTGTNAGTDTVTVGGAGTTASATVLVSALNLAFTTPASGATLPTATPTAVTVHWQNGAANVVGQTVTFSTTRGTVTTPTVVTDGAGNASTTISSTSAGPATITANTAAGQIQLQVTYIAQNAASLVLQANPSSVAPNQSGNTNQATLSAQVRDAAGNAVAGRTVSFTAVTDPTGGSISPATAVTDGSGFATSQFIPGGAPSPTNGVVIQASVQGTSPTVSGTTSLTVSQQALFISIFTGNQIGNRNQTTYEKQFSVLVNDANGAAVPGKVVSLSVFPTNYLKGSLEWDGTAYSYAAPGATVCANEDTDRDGSIDPGEDINNNGSLQPGLPVSVDVGTVTTDATGSATFHLLYGENYAPWVDTLITARASVGGTESIKTFRYFLVGSAPDFTVETNPPAGTTSPFGIATSCTSAN